MTSSRAAFSKTARFSLGPTAKPDFLFAPAAMKLLALLPLLVVSPLAAAIPVVDLSSDTVRHVVIAGGTPEVYQGHPTTLLMPDGKTMLATWSLGHGGACGPMKRSTDGGKTWSPLLETPADWQAIRNCPALYRLTDPQGKARLFVFAGQGPDGAMHQSISLDDGQTWSPMRSNGLKCVMPFCTIAAVDHGQKLIGLTNIRRPGETKDPRSNIIAQSESTDGGLTWGPWRILLDLGPLKPCEPEVVRSPDGKQLLCLMRENVRTEPARFMTSDDEGRTWSSHRALPPGLHGDRHKAVYTSDGRLVVAFRDMGRDSPTKNHFVAWVGRYEDMLAGRDGQYKIKLLHSHKGSDCGYPGLEILPDGTLVATTYVKYRPGANQNSVVSVRFTLADADSANKSVAAPTPNRQAVAGLLLDDDQAAYEGSWARSNRLPPLVGSSYRTVQRQTAATATFTPTVPAAGNYEVRLLYTPSANRAKNITVTIKSAAAAQSVVLNQQEACLIDGIPRALGIFPFQPGTAHRIEISADNSAGYMVVDGLQLVPEEEAAAERRTAAPAGFPTGGPKSSANVVPPAVTVPPPMQLQNAAKPHEVDGSSYDLVVVGGTPGGIACAVRAAREGLRVLLVNHTQHLGGFITSGAGGWEAPSDALRSPLYAEMLESAANYYRDKYGAGSPQHIASLPSQTSRAHIDRAKVEPRIAELLFNQMVEREKSLTVLLGHIVTRAECAHRQLQSILLEPRSGGAVIRVQGTIFADAMYEGDLLAAAGVKSQIGRESRNTYAEPHAGVIYTRERHKQPGQRGFPAAADSGQLNIRYNSHATAEIVSAPDSGAADDSVMAYNYRLILTRDPANRIFPAKPANYDVALAKEAGSGGFVPNLPNGKVAWNGGRLIGPQNGYPAGSWQQRDQISQQYLSAMLMRLWWAQHDPAAPESERQRLQGYGLAADEFPDNGHLPYEIYVREARRLVGRYVFKEQDNLIAPGSARTPIHFDSIAMTDWPVDSVACLPRRVAGANTDGIFFLAEVSRPAQVPYRCLLPTELDNLLVPVALSASHVGWGAIRLEPVWMQTGESAGFAAALAIRHHASPASLSADLLVRKLAASRVMVTFFNDVDVTLRDERISAAQYFGTQGFFASYDAQLDAPLSESLRAVWRDGFRKLQQGDLDPQQLVHAVTQVEQDPAPPGARSRGEELLSLWKQLPTR